MHSDERRSHAGRALWNAKVIPASCQQMLEGKIQAPVRVAVSVAAN